MCAYRGWLDTPLGRCTVTGSAVETRAMVFTGLHLVLWAQAEGKGFLMDNEKETTSGVKRRMRVLERCFKEAQGADSKEKISMKDATVRDAPAFGPMRHAEL
jgi:hypothetical protein